jgi:NAD(P)-dependent dehydrogenase (short-subunit alcohol dehydrogenase family)
MVKDLEGKRVLVVGASGGIGREVGLAATERGAEVVFAARRKDRLEEAVAEAKRGYIAVGDVTEAEDCDRIVADAVGHIGGLDIVVYCAGWAPLARLEQLREADWQKAVEVNLFGAHHVIRAAAPYVGTTGIIALVSSEGVGTAFPGLIGYSSTKAALEHLVRGWLIEKPGLRLTCLRVGQTVPTEFGNGFDPELTMEVMRDWVDHGLAQQEFMATEDLGRALAGLLAVMLPLPGIGLEFALLRSPSGLSTDFELLEQTFQESVAKLADSHDTEGDS